MVVIEGEAGIGKTRLGEALAASVRAAGGVVLVARGSPGEAGIAYGPDRRADPCRTGSTRRRRPAAARSMRPPGSSSRALIDLPAALARARATRTRDREREGPSARSPSPNSLMVLCAGPAPGLVWIDDLHLADEPTREVGRLPRAPADRTSPGPRPGLAARGPQRRWSHLGRRPRTDPRCRRVTLDRLDRSAIAAIVRATRRGPIDDAFLDVVADESEGLPLYLVEALAASDPSDVRVGGGVDALLRERIGSVGQMAAQVLSSASVIGRSFDLATVRYASGRSDDETVEALEELIRRGLVRELPDEPAATPATTSATVGYATPRTTGPASPVAGCSTPGRRTALRLDLADDRSRRPGAVCAGRHPRA